MFKLELCKSIRNKTFLYILSSVFLSYVLGYILPIGIDKVNQLSVADFYFSTYTVFTQFGFLIFGFVIVYFFNKDFSDQTILLAYFYGYHSLKFLFTKISVLVLEFIFSIMILNMLVATIFHVNVFYFLFSTILFSLIIFQYTLIISTISILYSNLLVSIGVSLFYWLLTIILVSVGGMFKIAAIFDASNSLYSIVEKVFSAGKIFDILDFLVIIPYMLILILASVFIGIVSQKRWVKNAL